MHYELIRLATIDPLTGLYNRRGFFEQATEACARSDGAVSAIILDIDRFKSINDCYGHDTGDEAMRVCAAAARAPEALAGRLGGDEFALILERRALPEAVEIAEALRHRLSAHPLQTHKGPVTLTWSVGVGEASPGDTLDQLLARADVPRKRAGAIAWSAQMPS